MRRSSRLKGKESCQIGDKNEGVKEDNLEALATQACAFITQRISSSKSDASHVPVVTSSPALSRGDGQAEEFIGLSTEFRKKSKDPTDLASELQPQLDTDNLYLTFDVKKLGQVKTSGQLDVAGNKDKELMKRSVITSDFEKQEVAPPMKPSFRALKKAKKQAREETAGPMWYNLPATTLTPELKQDLKLLKMRNMLDRKRHYKKNDTGNLPKYFQVGTVVAGSADFFSSRVPKRERKQNLVDELLADAEFRRYNKKKYLEIQASKQSGKKGFYKKKMNKRKATWARK